MEPYLRERQRQEKTAKAVGLGLAAALHVAAALLLVFSGVKYLYPPPQEQTFLIDFQDSEEELISQRFDGDAPRAEEPDLSREVEIVQRSASPYDAAKENLTPEAKPDDFGDVSVPTPEPKEEPKLDPRASFPGMAKKDTSLTAPHSATNPSATFKAGQPKGNTNSGVTSGRPNAHLEGRSVNGSLPRPSYGVQKDGTVVVDIWVDPYGNVTEARPGAEGTTVTDSELWNAARKAALGAHFNQSPDAPARQHGTITYIFKLK